MFHVFRKSLKRFDAFSIAMGSFLLAAKVEESFKTLREVLFAFHFVYGKRKGLYLKPMELGGQQYTSWKNELIMMERYILKELGFSLYNIMDHPHKYILYFIKVLNGSEQLANVAWGYLNDSMRLDLSLRFQAQTIACAAIYLAARKLGISLPGDGEEGSWWEVFSANTADLLFCSNEILTVYDMPKVLYISVFFSHSVLPTVVSLLIVFSLRWVGLSHWRRQSTCRRLCARNSTSSTPQTPPLSLPSLPWVEEQ